MILAFGDETVGKSKTFETAFCVVTDISNRAGWPRTTDSKNLAPTFMGATEVGDGMAVEEQAANSMARTKNVISPVIRPLIDIRLSRGTTLDSIKKLLEFRPELV